MATKNVAFGTKPNTPKLQMGSIAALSLRGVYMRELREARTAIIGWGIVLGLLINSVVVAFPTDPAKRATFAADYLKATANLRIYGDPVALDTFGGFVTWRLFGFMALMLGIWALLAGSRLIRGDEQRGRLDVLLSTPTSHSRLLLARAAAYATALTLALAMTLAVSTAIIANTVFVADYPVGAVALVMLNFAAITLCFAALALLLAQVVRTRRTAASITGVVLGAAYFGNNLAGSSDALKALRVVNPIYYFGLSKPLVPSVGMNWAAIGGLFAAAAILTAAAAWLFARRDIGQPFVLFGTPRSATAAIAIGDKGAMAERAMRHNAVTLLHKARSVWLRSVFGATLRDLRGTLLFWGAGSAAYTWLIISIASTAQDAIYKALANNPAVLKVIGGDLRLNNVYLSYALFAFLPVIVALYAITLVAVWCGDQEEGRVEVVLSTPITRSRLIVARLVAAGVALACVLALTYVVLLISGAAYNFSFDVGNAAIGTLLCWVLAMAVVGAGFWLAAVLRRPSTAVVIVATIVGILFFVGFLGPAISLPDWLLNLSPFVQIGQPLLNGLHAWGQVALVVEALLLTVASVVAFQRRDIVK